MVVVGGGGRWNTILQVVSKVIGCATRKFFSINKILEMVFQSSHCQDTGTPVWWIFFILMM